MSRLSLFLILFVVLLYAKLGESYDERCNVNYDEGRCKIVTRYRYDRRARRCLPFDYRGEGGNKNNFNTLEDCQFRCENDRPLSILGR
ncbi:PREDICTED: kunitz-type serine protease inhibitor homolog delta-dendrotoxin-like [Papilio polytes]|uniref:BPTI/Kunitz inhibitor domain-containing protein n=1 Tax=Papilio polytes TaxID=76194 RepID=I4DMA3_PAPPL|nr:PREDICTED: kunitz-type serine protease inhibitor homolog delta-dendrotoxin-like [Papilio polytes]BAM19043.1 unknown secreted protein [Papilio polytes]